MPPRSIELVHEAVFSTQKCPRMYPNSEKTNSLRPESNAVDDRPKIVQAKFDHMWQVLNALVPSAYQKP